MAKKSVSPKRAYGKAQIMRDAFELLYEDLGGNLKDLLDKLVVKPGRPVPTHGRPTGNTWTCPGCNYYILLGVDNVALGKIKADKDYRIYRDATTGDPKVFKAKGYTYKGTTYDNVNFLLFEDWDGKDSKKAALNKATCDLINSFAPVYGRKYYISHADVTAMTSPGGKGSSTSTIPPAPTVVGPGTSALPISRKQPDLNLILYGPPGTGKTYNTVNKALEILEPTTDWTSVDRKDAITAFNKYKASGHIVFTTFHQSMSYEDFIEGIKPKLDDESSVGYTLDKGLFKRISEEAEKPENTQKKYVLIIDEINRGNIANIFGELITLIEDDKRTTKWDKTKGTYVDNPEAIRVKLPYSKDKEPEFGVPGNLYIIGTMNTADRSVEALDSALRRRFSFEEMMPKPNLLASVTIDGLGKTLTLEDLLSTINERIEVLKDREHQIGHSYFMGLVAKGKKHTTVKPEELKSVFTDKIIPLLQEYFYGDYEKIRLVVGDVFVKPETVKIEFAGKVSVDDLPEKKYSIEKNPDMTEALKKLLNIKAE